MCKTRAKFIVVLDTSLFGAEARGIVAFRPQGTNPVASVCEKEGPEWPFDSAQIWGWTAGERAGLSFDALCWAWPWASFPIQASLEPAGLSEDAPAWLEL